MPLHEKQYSNTGKPETSALSGKTLNPEDPYFQIKGYTLGVKARELWGLSAEEFEAMKTAWADDLPAAVEPEAVVPAYEDLSFEDLKSLANKRGVDITGRRSKEDIRQALVAADVMERFTPSVTTKDNTAALDLSQAKGD